MPFEPSVKLLSLHFRRARSVDASYSEILIHGRQSSQSVAISGTPTPASTSKSSTASATATETDSTASSASGSSASAKASGTHNAANIYAPAGGLLAIGMGVAGLL
jgi:hypothetical protein